MRNSITMLALGILSLFVIQCSSAKKVTIYRDTWGVPHIYADSDISLAFGMGYAQAEDRIEQLMMNYRWSLGRMAEVLGPDYTESDYSQKVWRHEQVARENFANLAPELQQMLTAFIQGARTYLEQHPDKKPAIALELKPWYPMALGRAFIWGWPLGQAIDDYNNGIKKVYDPKGSNQWAVSGSRTESGAPILLVDPHLSWFQEGHWFEVRLHGKNIHASGMSVTGTPFVGLGHNRSLAWAATTGGPDGGDCYEEILNPDNPLQYKYDNGWRELKIDTVTIKVREEQRVKTVKRLVERTRHGPIYKKDGNRAYALALPYENEYKLIEQMLAMNLAKNVDEFKTALAKRQFMPQNIMVADNEGNIYYQRTGRVPVRDLSFDWSRPVPGWKTATDWNGIHSTDDLVQLLNPEQGFMQNCNISPGTMLPSSPMVASAYRPYIYNDRTGRTNSRGMRAIELLQSDESLSFNEAQAIAMDVVVPGLRTLQQELQQAYAENPQPDIEKEVKALVNWDGSLDKGNRTAPLFSEWFGRVISTEKINPYQNNLVLDKETRRRILDQLRWAQQELVKQFGTTDLSWGETLRLSRGDRSFPLGGGEIGRGYSAIRSVWGQTENGVTTGTGGQTGPMVIELTRPVKSVSVVPWGQSDDPESTHFFDQGEKLFQYRKMKPTWFEWKELKEHIESKTVLVVN